MALHVSLVRVASLLVVALAVGEGVMAVHLVHRFLADSIERQNVLSH
jgi:hypothetical protein